MRPPLGGAGLPCPRRPSMLRCHARPADPIAMSDLLKSTATTEDLTFAASAHEIAVLPGDGIGTEVMAEGIRVLRAVEKRLPGVSFELSEHPVGAAEYLRHGNPLPESSFTACEQADAILLGAMGLPSVRWPDGKEMTPQIDLRERLDLYNGVRPNFGKPGAGCTSW